MTDTKISIAKALTPEEIAAIDRANDVSSAPDEGGEVPKTTHTKAQTVAKRVRAAEVTIQLEYEIEFDGKLYAELTLRRLKGADLLQLQGMSDLSEEESQAQLLAALTKAPVEVIAELDVDDFLTLNEAAGPFIPKKFLEASEMLTGATGQNAQQP